MDCFQCGKPSVFTVTDKTGDTRHYCKKHSPTLWEIVNRIYKSERGRSMWWVWDKLGL